MKSKTKNKKSIERGRGGIFCFLFICLFAIIPYRSNCQMLIIFRELNSKRLYRTVQEKKRNFKSLSCGFVLHEDVLLERNEEKVVVISGGSRGGVRAHTPYLRVRMTGRSATGYVVLGLVYD